MNHQKLQLRGPHLGLLAIVILALSFRLWGIGFSLPYVGYVSDETRTVDPALHILRQASLDFSALEIGTLFYYLQAGLQKVILNAYGISPNDLPTFAELQATQNISAPNIGMPYPIPELYLWGRVVVAVFGTLSVLVIYLIGQELGSPRVGLVAAFFLAGLTLHVEMSHYLIRTVPSVFFFLLALYIIFLAHNRQKWILYVVSLAPIFLAIYTKQNMLIILSPFGLALVMSLWSEFRRRPVWSVLKNVGIAFAALGIGILLSWFFLGFNSFDYVQSIVDRIVNHPFVYGGVWVGASGDDGIQWLVNQFFVERPERYIFFASIPGLLLAITLKRERPHSELTSLPDVQSGIPKEKRLPSVSRAGWLLLAVILPYLFIFSFFTVRWFRWLSPVIMCLILLAALFLDWGYEKLSRLQFLKKSYSVAIYLIVIIAISGSSIYATVMNNYTASQADVRNVASEWLPRNLPAGSKVVIDEYGPYLYTPDLETIYINSLADYDLQQYRDQGVNYLIANELKLATVLYGLSDQRTSEYAHAQSLIAYQIITELSVEQEFVGPFVFTPDRRIRIYKLQ